jgi:hypothetical protein
VLEQHTLLGSITRRSPIPRPGSFPPTLIDVSLLHGPHLADVIYLKWQWDRCKGRALVCRFENVSIVGVLRNESSAESLQCWDIFTHELVYMPVAIYRLLGSTGSVASASRDDSKPQPATAA